LPLWGVIQFATDGFRAVYLEYGMPKTNARRVGEGFFNRITGQRV